MNRSQIFQNSTDAPPLRSSLLFGSFSLLPYSHINTPTRPLRYSTTLHSVPDRDRRIRLPFAPEDPKLPPPVPSMAVENKETHRVSRAMAKKRSASDTAAACDPEVLEADPKRRKRVVLGDITHLCNGKGIDACDALKPVKEKADKKKRNVDESEILSCVDDVNCDAVGGSDSVLPDHMIFDKDAIDIHTYLRSMEVHPKNRAAPNYIEVVQKEMTTSMRAILVDWLVEVAEEYKLSSVTLYLAISYIDRFLSCQRIQRSKLQLLGVACMLAASKYEEISPPNIEDFCYITDNTYTKQDVAVMELEVLKFLKWEMGAPTAKTFLWRYLNCCQDQFDSSQLEFLSNYLAELSFLDYNCVRFLPSVVAASAVFLARLTLNPISNPWSPALHHCSKYKPSDLQDCINYIVDLQLNKKMASLTAIRDKYKQTRFKSVASLVPPPEIPSTYFQDLY